MLMRQILGWIMAAVLGAGLLTNALFMLILAEGLVSIAKMVSGTDGIQ